VARFRNNHAVILNYLYVRRPCILIFGGALNLICGRAAMARMMNGSMTPPPPQPPLHYTLRI
jgi:hypothetical protein